MRIVLGKKGAWKGVSAKRRCVAKEDCVMYVPVLQTLEALLKNKVVISEVSCIF